MSLRTLVTGSDMCTPSDGAGPSNAVGALVNQLLGGASKTQEQLREFPVQQGPVVPQHAPITPEAAAAAAASASIHVPGMAQPSGSLAHLDAFFPGAGPSSSAAAAAARHTADMVAEFERHQQSMPQMPPGQLPPGALMPGQPPPPMLAATLKAFLTRGHPGMPALPPGQQLSLPDAVRLRDRATILARQMYGADAGAMVADQQVAALLTSLAIDPASLPAELPHQSAPPEWAALWEHQVARGRPPEPLVGAEMAAAAARAAAAAGPAAFEDVWRQQQQRPQSTGWADDFVVQQQQQRGPAGWAEEFSKQETGPQPWANEFEQVQESAATSAAANAAAAADARATSARLVNALAADGDPKMRNSKFFQFLSKMSKGELTFDDNKVVERPASEAWAADFAAANGKADSWAAEFGANSSAAAAASNWSSEFMQQQQQPGVQRDWADEFAKGFANINIGDGATESELEAAWAAVGSGGAQTWAAEFEHDLDDQTQADWEALYAKGAARSPRAIGEYEFSEANPFLGDPAALEKGKDLFKRGLLSEAALALEAEVRAHPENAPAWRLLGTVHAENDDDRQAIAALQKAMHADPENLEVLLALGVSHTNELDAGEALGFLHRWISNHPTYRDAAAAAGPPLDSSQALSHTVRLFEGVLAGPGAADPELHLALGVLHHLNRRYEGAIKSFQNALELRPGDYSLWNKLGATLANYSHSGEAVAAYRKALDLKPNYMRAWTNMGISYANLGDYMASAAYYVRALSLNPAAEHVWGYLRTSLACSGQIDLLNVVETRDLPALQKALPL